MSFRDTALDIIARVSGRDRSQLAPDQQLVGDLEFDSARALELMVELEDGLGIELPDEALAGMTTVADVLAAVEQATAAG